MSQYRTACQAALLAAVVAFACTLIMGFVARPADPAVSPQPSDLPRPEAEFMRATREYPDSALLFFAADSLFVLSYAIVFAGLHAATMERAPALALIALGAGLFTATCDAVENAHFVVYALQAKAGLPVLPALPLLYLLTNLKWMGAFLTLYAFGLIFPRAGALDWVITGLMLLFPIIGVAGIALPALVPLRGAFFLLGMPLFAWFFFRQGRL